MVATVDGTVLTCAPIRVDELEDAIVELVARLGEPTCVEVRHLDGKARRAMIDPANPRVHRLMRARRWSTGSRPGTRVRKRLEGLWFVLALAVALASTFLLGHIVAGAGLP